MKLRDDRALPHRRQGRHVEHFAHRLRCRATIRSSSAYVTAERVRGALRRHRARRGRALRAAAARRAEFRARGRAGRRGHAHARARRARQVAQLGAARHGDSDERHRVLRDRRESDARGSCLLALTVAVAPRSRASRSSRASRARSAGRHRWAYEMLRGAIHGEVDPTRSAQRASFRTSTLAPRNARGRVEYVATFSLAKPIDLTSASGVLIYWS